MGIKIISEFKDCYDHLQNENSKLVYKRFGEKSKAKRMKLLDRMNIERMQIASVREIYSKYNQLVVYTEVSLNQGEGKVVMDSEEANIIYPNHLAMEFVPQYEDTTLKFLQLGSRRFGLRVKKINDLKNSEIKSIQEIKQSYCFNMTVPIFSIDYINYNNRLVAVDMDTAQNLSRINMEKFIDNEKIISLIESALIKYHK